MVSDDFSHFDSQGNARMVDVSAKEVSPRTAIAKGRIAVGEETFNRIQAGGTAKGDVLGVARIAGIMAAKRCADLIPLCHPLIFDTCTIDFEFLDAAAGQGTRFIEAVCSVKLRGKTGAEMEALTGVSLALLTIYDMCKAIDRGMVIGDVMLWEKSGGKSGHYQRSNGVAGDC
jgi:cyclic pyranopterin phosphate synthase